MSIAFCVGAFVPVIYPGLGTALRPGLPLMIAVFLANAFAQVDLSHAKRNVSRPLRLLSATCWATLAIPVLFWTILTIIGRDRLDPGLVLARHSADAGTGRRPLAEVQRNLAAAQSSFDRLRDAVKATSTRGIGDNQGPRL
jgi:hypothetical protein